MPLARSAERYGNSPDVLEAPDGTAFFSTPEEMSLPEGVKRGNFIAVIHIDGNDAGSRGGNRMKEMKQDSSTIAWSAMGVSQEKEQNGN